MRPEQTLTDLNEEQVRAVTLPGGPLAICAGAGTGKTRTVTARIAYRVAAGEFPAQSVLAVTHSTRAAGSMRDALRRFPIADLEHVATRTIHAAALNQLRFFWQQLDLPGDGPVVCSDQGKTVRDIAAALRLSLNPGQVASVLGEIAWAKTTLLAPESYANTARHRRAPVPPERVAEIYARYEASLRTRNLLDHTDLLTRATALIQEHESVAQTVRRRARFLVVDEYQDTDPAQQQLLEAWLGDGEDITVVGDPRQAIYAFKGSDPELLATFPQRHPAAAVVELTRNYRSTPQIVEAANSLASALPGAAATTAALKATNPAGPTPCARRLATVEAENSWVVAQIAGAIRAGGTPGGVAVLVRDNDRARHISDLLEGAAIPSWVSGGTRFFDAPEIVAVRTRMRAALEAGFDYSGATLLREALASYGFDRDAPPPTGTPAAPVWRARRELLRWVEAMPAAELLSGRHLLAELERAAASGHRPGVDAVFVGTVHAAKGLEFDSVYSLGWDETWRSSGQDGNLAYVAVTRARRHLTLTWAGERAGKAVSVSPLVAASGFVPSNVDSYVGGRGDAAADRPAATRRPRPAKAATGTCRRCTTALPAAAASLGVCARHLKGQDAMTWAAIAAWRADQAVVDGCPTYRVLTDATVLSLVAQRPSSLADLARIGGVGRVTLSRHGSTLLALVAAPNRAST